MSRLKQKRDSLHVVNDQIGSPAYAADLAKAILTIITHPNLQSGIYNYSNEGAISWFEFALAIQEIGGFQCEITGISSADFPYASASSKIFTIRQIQNKKYLYSKSNGVWENLGNMYGGFES